MTADIKETALTIDHDSGDIYLDTRSQPIASMALRAGLRETTKSNSAPYRRFRGSTDLVDFILRKKRQGLPSQASLDALRMAREARAASPKTAQDSSQDTGEV